MSDNQTNSYYGGGKEQAQGKKQLLPPLVNPSSSPTNQKLDRQVKPQPLPPPPPKNNK
jgi:hypothetical protein